MYIIGNSAYYTRKDLETILYPGKLIKVIDITPYHKYSKKHLDFPRPSVEENNGFYKLNITGRYIVMTTDGYSVFTEGKYKYTHIWAKYLPPSLEKRTDKSLY